MAEFDLVLKGGTVVDGTRFPRHVADVGIVSGRIGEIGRIPTSSAERVLHAEGLVVAPGFVDLHTHYDAQIQWDPYCSISGWHGVTSVVLGNCGFGFAPVQPQERERSMLTMTRTEAIPFESMREGMLWDWVTFPEWLDTLGRIPKGVNCLSYMPVAPLMTWVMGLDAAKSRGATDAELAEMQRLLDEAMERGACGFSVQRLGENSLQADFDGTPMVTDTMRDEEVLALAEVLDRRGEGFIQLTQATGDFEQDMKFEEELARVSGRPILHNVVIPFDAMPEVHRRQLEWLERCHRDGLQIFGQSLTGRGPFTFSLANWNLYDTAPAWNEALTGTFEEKRQKLRNRELCERMKAESDAGLLAEVVLGGPISGLIIQSVCGRAEYADFEGRTVGDLARERGVHPVEALIELSLETDLAAEFQTANGTSNQPELMAELMASPYTIPGVSDGGAHTKFFTGGSYTTDFLTWLVRDTETVTLEEAHYRLSYLPARAAGFRDRGVLREGAPADVVVYDLEGLRRVPEWNGEIVHDLPAGEWRRVQRAEGYRWILVNGEVTFEDGKCTGATPGRLLRHGRG